MTNNEKKIAVIGGGSWATALVKILTSQKILINWWMHNEASAAHIIKYRHNPKYLQSVEFNLEHINVSTDLKEIIEPADIIIIATPTAYSFSTSSVKAKKLLIRSFRVLDEGREGSFRIHFYRSYAFFDVSTYSFDILE